MRPSFLNIFLMKLKNFLQWYFTENYSFTRKLELLNLAIIIARCIDFNYNWLCNDFRKYIWRYLPLALSISLGPQCRPIFKKGKKKEIYFKFWPALSKKGKIHMTNSGLFMLNLQFTAQFTKYYKICEVHVIIFIFIICIFCTMHF